MAAPALRARAKKLRSEAKGGTARLRTAASAGVTQARVTTEAGQGAIKAARAGTGKLWVQVLGGILLLSLIYLLVAGKGSQVIGKLVGMIGSAVRALIAPEDPIAKLESAFGATPISASQGSGSGGASEASAASSAAGVGGASLAGGNAGPTQGGTLPPSPLAAGRAGVARARQRRGASTREILALNRKYAAKGVHMTRRSLRALSTGQESIGQAEAAISGLPWAPGQS